MDVKLALSEYHDYSLPSSRYAQPGLAVLIFLNALSFKWPFDQFRKSLDSIIRKATSKMSTRR